jgi:hypothetical protein
MESEKRLSALENTQRVVERNFDILPTHIDGFYLLVDHGENLDEFTRGKTRQLKDTGNVYGARSALIKQLLELQQEPHSQLVEMGINSPGLRGGRDVNTGFEVQINPETTDIFDESLMDLSLGEKRPEVAHKKISVTVEFDPDREDAEAFIATVKRRLKRQGISKDEIEKRVKVKRALRVDEKALKKMIDEEQVSLMPGTWNIETKKWDIVSRKISTRQELLEAEEKSGN